MRPVRNADDSLRQFRKICEDYERYYRPLITTIRKRLTDGSSGKHLLPHDECLEAHSRVYIVNALLAALNWRLDKSPGDGLPNLVPETPIRSEEWETIRFFDYLGFEKGPENPLLIVETKRPNTPLPHALTQAPTYSEIVSRGLAGEPLQGEWNKWLDSLRDYVCSLYKRTQEAPRRVVLTNGDWLILFLDPFDAFLKDGTRNPNLIIVFLDRSDIEKRFRDLFLHLEHGLVLGETPAPTPRELLFYIDPGTVDQAMHGLHLHYIEEPGIYQKKPVIKVAPILFLHLLHGSWLRVETTSQEEYELPHQKKLLSKHLREVKKAARKLLDQVNEVLQTSLQPLPLSQHYKDENAFEPIRGVVEYGTDKFLVVTGDKTHYLVPEPSVPDCLYHDWTVCDTNGVGANPGPIVKRSVEPRSFFVSGELQHCAHRDVFSAKENPITVYNRERCGLRSGEEGQAFCEIWRFEQHLCCRTCVFEEVCKKSEVFRLPCIPPEPPAVRTITHSLRRRNHGPS